MSIKIGRNEPCPCGSGKKYKKCCIDKPDDRSFSDPLNFMDNYKSIRKESKLKHCLHPESKACSERIIGAHSIQNNKILKRIASNGHVYMPCPKPDNPFEVMTKWGRKEATVFTGFCGHHDNSVFQPIEDGIFDKSDLHVFLYTYRCFAVEYHKKQEVANMQKNIFKRKPSLIQMSKEDDPFKGMLLAIDDFEPVKSAFDNALLEQKYDILSSIIWEFPGAVNFAGSGFEAPMFDLKGNYIQDLLDDKMLAKHLFIIVFPEEEKTYFIISWLKDNDEFFSEYAAQLKQLDLQQRKNYINSTLPIISENIALNPDAWDRWEKYKKDEFGSLLWGLADISEMDGSAFDRFKEPMIYDLFEL